MTVVEQIAKSSKEYRGSSRANSFKAGEAAELYSFIARGSTKDWVNSEYIVEIPMASRTLKRSVFVSTYAIRSDFEIQLAESLEGLKRLENDWDGGDAMAPIVGNLDDAKQFLLRIHVELKRIGLNLSMPELNPCNDGSLDVVWRQPENFLLLNFRDPEQGLVHYYFDNYDTKLARQSALELSGAIPRDFNFYLQAIVE